MNYQPSTHKAAAQSQPSELSRVLLLVNAELKHSGRFISASPLTERMIQAFKTAIHHDLPDVDIDVVTPAMVRYQTFLPEADTLVCPLTIDLPERTPIDQHELFQACRKIDKMREWVLENTNHKVCHRYTLGHYWLPIVCADENISFGKIIGEGIVPNSYDQPVDFPEEKIPSLHELGKSVLELVSAKPSVYLLQFAHKRGVGILFDRLWPFPAAPAIASLQNEIPPNLFECHWRCLTNQPLPEKVFVQG